jgi:hypothetical protein
MIENTQEAPIKEPVVIRPLAFSLDPDQARRLSDDLPDPAPPSRPRGETAPRKPG